MLKPMGKLNIAASIFVLLFYGKVISNEKPSLASNQTGKAHESLQSIASLRATFHSSSINNSYLVLEKDGSHYLAKENQEIDSIKIKEIMDGKALLVVGEVHFLLSLSNNENSYIETLMGEEEATDEDRLNHRKALNILDLHLMEKEEIGKGYLVGPNFPERLQKSYGVKPGDILISANSISLGTIEKDIEAFLTYRATGLVIFEIYREGNYMIIDNYKTGGH